MSVAVKKPPAAHREAVVYLVIFVGAALFNVWATRVGWESRNLPGVEFRQAQTAISAYYIQQEHDFSLAYPTPVLGKPWSVPLEFPLYQWTVVGLSNVTGLDLTKSGRVVSQSCFYFCLPAVFLLLGKMGVSPGRRWLVLAVIVTCPFYIFYSRAFLIETMVLMFSLWFWVAFEKSVESRSWRWLLVAMLAGTGAGLVKVTTFLLYLLPTGWWALRRLWDRRRDQRWRGDFVWMALAVALPFAGTLWWLHFADATKALNPSAQFVREANLRDFTLGTWADHTSLKLWRQKWEVVAERLAWWPLLAGGGFLAVMATRKRQIDALRFLGWFSAVLFIFPVLYAVQEYYFMANGMLLLLALGLILVGLAENGHPVWLVGLISLLIVGCQAYRYGDGYYQHQKGISPGGDELTRSLALLTKPDEVLVITGQDWNSMIPYYAKRRALMIRLDAESAIGQLDAAFANLADEKIGALVIGPSGVRSRPDLVRRAVALGIDAHPLYGWRDVAVYLRKENREAGARHIAQAHYPRVALIPLPRSDAGRLTGEWFTVAGLVPAKRDLFAGMNPTPVRFFSTYGPATVGDYGWTDFGAHPITRLVFSLPAGPHVLRTKVRMPPDTYDGAQLPDRMTDGVEITLKALTSSDKDVVLFTRLLNPRDNPADRGLCPLEVSFTLDRPGDVELFFGPGPAWRDTHDSILLGPLEIQ